jgi:hypothetical protein
MIRDSVLPAALIAAVLGAILASDAATIGLPQVDGALAPRAARAAWSETNWPFPLDQWGPGRAFRCAPADCGTGIDLYLRAKVGFCNCTTGVADNGDLDRVSDLELFSDKFVGLTDGHPVSVGPLQGRSRLYHVTIPYAPARDMFAIGFNDQCDVAVATVLADRDRLADAERLALEFLNTERVLRWARAELGQNGI